RVTHAATSLTLTDTNWELETMACYRPQALLQVVRTCGNSIGHELVEMSLYFDSEVGGHLDVVEAVGAHTICESLLNTILVISAHGSTLREAELGPCGFSLGRRE